MNNESTERGLWVDNYHWCCTCSSANVHFFPKLWCSRCSVTRPTTQQPAEVPHIETKFTGACAHRLVVRSSGKCARCGVDMALWEPEPEKDMTRPITPEEVFGNSKHFPQEVIDAFNELIAETRGHVLQKDVMVRILEKMHQREPGLTRQAVFDKGWLDVEDVYRKAGWDVEYDKPGRGDDYEAFFVFSRKGQ